VRLSYYVPSRDEQSERVVDPRGVVNRDGHAYLDAWCHLAEAPRLFRLDRIVTAEVLPEPIATEPAAPRDLADGFFTRDTEVTRATVLLEPQARWVTDYYPAEEVREVGEGRLEVDYLVADQRWLTRLVLGLLPHARVLAPRTAADAVTATARETLELYG
jgi:proteasome accessory factor C